MKKAWKIVLVVLVVLLAGAGWLIASFSGRGVDPNNPTQFIQHDFIDLGRIGAISKFRSGEGHDFSGSGETCRSMKHYFTPLFDPSNAEAYQKDSNGLPPKPDGQTDIPIYSPVDGTIFSVSEEKTPIGKQVSIRPTQAKQYTIRLFHVFLKDGVGSGSKVTAGQQIGVIGRAQGTDIAIQVGQVPWKEQFISYFQVLPESIFATYKERGATAKTDFIITKEYRDAHPLQCNGEQFVYPAAYDYRQDDVYLSGYVDQSAGSTTDQNQSAVSLDLTASDTNKTIQLKREELLNLTADQGTTALDLSNYDLTLIKETSTGQYQLKRTIQGLKAGQTDMNVTLTPSCAIPKSGQTQCGLPSRQITLKIVVS